MEPETLFEGAACRSACGACARLLAGEQGSLQIARVALLAFYSEEIRTAGAHGDPGEGHHQDPWRAGNKTDPSVDLSSSAFHPRLLPLLLSL